jgi:glycosyltransferase involved in cell wall biosynthesis
MIRTIVHFVESTEFGGNEQALLQLLAFLDRNRWRPVLFHYPEPGLEPLLERAQNLGVTLRTIPRLQGIQAAAGIPQLVRELQRERPAVFHAHLNWPMACKFGLIAAALARIPAVVATAQLFVEYQFPLKPVVYLLQQLIAMGVDRYIAVSKHVAQRLHQTYGFSAPKVCVVHNSALLNSFDSPRVNNELRTRFVGTDDRPIVLTVARLDKQKGLSYLLEAATLVPDAVFVLAGEGPERSALEAQMRTLGLQDRVHFLGYRQDIPELLTMCDLFVLPSLFEGFPLSILEAMAAEKPVVATAIGGTDEAVIHGETGLLVPPADPAALAQAIQAILSAPVFGKQLGAAGRARVCREFSAEVMVQRVTQIYEEILSSCRERHSRHQSHA